MGCPIISGGAGGFRTDLIAELATCSSDGRVRRFLHALTDSNGAELEVDQSPKLLSGPIEGRAQSLFFMGRIKGTTSRDVLVAHAELPHSSL